MINFCLCIPNNFYFLDKVCWPCKPASKTLTDFDELWWNRTPSYFSKNFDGLWWEITNQNGFWNQDH
jgi:hypothetical protein